MNKTESLLRQFHSISADDVDGMVDIYAQQLRSAEWTEVVEGDESTLPEPGQVVLCEYYGILHAYAEGKGEKMPIVSGAGDSNYHVVRQLVGEDGTRWADEGVTRWHEI